MKIKLLYIIIFFCCFCIFLSRETYKNFIGKKIDPKLERTRKLMKEYKDDLFYMCPGIDNSKYFYTTKDFPKLRLLERKAGVIRQELKKVINQFEKPGILFPMENLQHSIICNAHPWSRFG